MFSVRLSLIRNGFLTRKISRLTQPIITKHMSIRRSLVRMKMLYMLPSRELTPRHSLTRVFSS